MTKISAPEQGISKIEIEVSKSEAKFESDAISGTVVRLHPGAVCGGLSGTLDAFKAAVPATAFKLR